VFKALLVKPIPVYSKLNVKRLEQGLLKQQGLNLHFSQKPTQQVEVASGLDRTLRNIIRTEASKALEEVLTVVGAMATLPITLVIIIQGR
jgi:hypothetical protein